MKRRIITVLGLYGARGKTVKSGLDIGNNDGEIKVAQKCPHTALQNVYASMNLSYRKLDLRLFVLGELEIISSGKIINCRKRRKGKVVEKNTISCWTF